MRIPFGEEELSLQVLQLFHQLIEECEPAQKKYDKSFAWKDGDEEKNGYNSGIQTYKESLLKAISNTNKMINRLLITKKEADKREVKVKKALIKKAEMAKDFNFKGKFFRLVVNGREVLSIKVSGSDDYIKMFGEQIK